MALKRLSLTIFNNETKIGKRKKVFECEKGKYSLQIDGERQKKHMHRQCERDYQTQKYGNGRTNR